MACLSGLCQQDRKHRKGEAEDHHDANEHRRYDPNDSGILGTEVDDHAYIVPCRSTVRRYVVSAMRRYGVWMQTRDVTDPGGADWRLTLEWAMVSTAGLQRAIERSGKTFRKPRFWERGRTDKFGVKPEPGPGVFYLMKLRPATRWEREHSYAWIVVASTSGPPPQKRAWISPAMRRADALLDLNELAGRIERGDEPQPDA